MADENDPIHEQAPIDYRAMAEFRHALSAYLHESNTLLRQAGFTPQQFACVLAIGGQASGEMSVGALARELHLTHHAAVELSQRVEGAGLLERFRDPGNGRQVLLRLTPHGRQELGRLALDHLSELEGARATLITTLNRWQDQLRVVRRQQRRSP